MSPQKIKEKENDENAIVDATMATEQEKKALEVAESAREERYLHPSFVRKLFMGDLDTSMVFPFPQQDPKDKEIGDDLIEKLEIFLRENLDPDEVDATRTIPDNVMNGLAKMGIFALKVPKEYGGLGFSQQNYARVISLIASYCGSTFTVVSAHQSIGVPQPLKLFGTEEQKRKYLPRFREGALSAFALTEPDVGSDPARMSTEAVLSDDGKYYILNGLKLWTTNGPISDVIVVMAKTAPKIVKGKEKTQISAFIVEMNSPGIEVLHRCDFLGIRAINNGLLKFTNVKVPKENLLWEEGKGLSLALKTLNVGRLSVPASCIGMGKQALSIARRWGNERVQWGQPIGLHESGRQKVSFIASTTFAMEAMTALTSYWADEGEVDLRIEAAMAKVFCTEEAWNIADTLLQFRGGRGYETAQSLKGRGETPYPVERMLRDARIGRIVEGTTEIMHLFLAREAIDPHLTRLIKLIKKGSIGNKFVTGLKLLGFYGIWFPKQFFNGSLFHRHSEMKKLAKHLRFVEKKAHKMARRLFLLMMRYQANLVAKQAQLTRLVEIGTYLFAMVTTCSYAVTKYEQDPSDETPIKLANHFCALARRKIEVNFNSLKDNDDKITNKLAEDILDGKMKWLEDDIIWMGPDN